MAQRLDEFSFRLPDGREVEIVTVRLPDGTITARTREEIERLEGEEKRRSEAGLKG